MLTKIIKAKKEYYVTCNKIRIDNIENSFKYLDDAETYLNHLFKFLFNDYAIIEEIIILKEIIEHEN